MTIRRLPLQLAGILAVLVLVPLASVDRTYAAVQLPSGNENTSIIVQIVGNAPGNIVVDFLNSGGGFLTSEEEQNVPAGGSRTFAQALSNLPAGYRGSAHISASQPIIALRVLDILQAQGNLKSYSIAEASAAGGSTLVFPLLLNELQPNQWNSRIHLVNTGTTTACIKTTFNVQGGGQVVDQPAAAGDCAGTGGRAIAAGGQLIWGRTGAVTMYPGGINNSQFSATVEVLNASATNAITGNADIYRSDGNRLLGSYQGFVVGAPNSTTDDVGTTVYAPIALKTASGYYTVIGILNMDNADANIQIRYRGSANGAPVDFTANLNGISSVASHSTYQTTEGELPQGFVGYAEVTSNTRIAVTVVRAKQTFYFSGVNEAIYGAVKGVPSDRASTTFNLPLNFRNFGGNVYNSWIQVLVPGGGNANVNIRYVQDPNSGCPGGVFGPTAFQVQGTRVFYLFQGDGFPGGNVPNCFWGSATVTSNVPVVVIAQVEAAGFPGGDSSGLYNGFPGN